MGDVDRLRSALTVFPEDPAQLVNFFAIVLN
jgi:hypothetical protein